MEDEDENWFDCTVLGSPYEVQTNIRTNQQRYRRRILTQLSPAVTTDPYNCMPMEIEYPWTYGLPPDSNQ